MNKKPTTILIKALELISQGTIDKCYPFRCAPRDVLMEYAKDALVQYKEQVSVPQDYKTASQIPSLEANSVTKRKEVI